MSVLGESRGHREGKIALPLLFLLLCTATTRSLLCCVRWPAATKHCARALSTARHPTSTEVIVVVEVRSEYTRVGGGVSVFLVMREGRIASLDIFTAVCGQYSLADVLRRGSVEEVRRLHTFDSKTPTATAVAAVIGATSEYIIGLMVGRRVGVWSCGRIALARIFRCSPPCHCSAAVGGDRARLGARASLTGPARYVL